MLLENGIGRMRLFSRDKFYRSGDEESVQITIPENSCPIYQWQDTDDSCHSTGNGLFFVATAVSCRKVYPKLPGMVKRRLSRSEKVLGGAPLHENGRLYQRYLGWRRIRILWNVASVVSLGLVSF